MRPTLALGRMTARELLTQPLPWVVAGATALLLLASTVMPSFTFEEQGDLKFMCDIGLTGVAMALLVIGLWPAATLLGDELQHRTAHVLLAKPLGRADYLVGRYLGIAAALAVMALVLTALFLGGVWLTEGRILSAPLDRWFEGPDPGTVAAPTARPGLRWDLAGACLLGWGQAATLAAAALALSTRLAPIPVLASCGGLFLLGHLGATLTARAGDGPAGWAVAVLRIAVPDLACFEVGEAIARGLPVPAGYVAACLGYAVLYATAVLAAAVPAFERQELA